MPRKERMIRNVCELPSWFDRNNYAAATELDAAGWYVQLKLRQDALCYLDFDESRVYPNTPFAIEAMRKDYAHGFRCVTDLLRLSPIAPPTAISTQPLFEGFFGPTYSAAVRTMTVGDLRVAERKLSVGRKQYSINWIDGIDDAFLGRKRVVFGRKNWINRPLHESSKCDLPADLNEIREQRSPWGDTPVVVNLSMPDAMLIEQFRDWLDEIRKTMSSQAGKRRYQRPDFESWIRFGVLPFLDLTIWAKENGLSIPNRVMADAIFEPWMGDSEAVRKTAAPLAMSLLKGSDIGRASTLEILAALAGFD